VALLTHKATGTCHGYANIENPPKIPEKIQWVAPKLVCDVAFAEWTEDEQLRQTTFLGWRDDKNADLVICNP
jgi:bifunctional non-homologous end joining protein LigD